MAAGHRRSIPVRACYWTLSVCQPAVELTIGFEFVQIIEAAHVAIGRFRTSVLALA